MKHKLQITIRYGQHMNNCAMSELKWANARNLPMGEVLKKIQKEIAITKLNYKLGHEEEK